MDPNLMEWINLALRWVHVFAGILWVGSTYYFTWLDGRFAEAEAQATEGAPGRVWMVHSGGFYAVEKRKDLGVAPGRVHWFRWEAAWTWLSGMLLLGLVYYHGGLLVDESVAQLSLGQAAGIGFGVIIAGWVVYDLLEQSPLGRSETAFAAVGYLLIVAAAYGLSQTLSGRAAYMHVGATLGTIMTANVWMRILPAQRRLIAAVAEGKTPDWSLSARAKLRSKHNTFLAVPVVFLMISSHFPTATYGQTHGWAVLAALVLAGWVAAKLIRRA